MAEISLPTYEQVQQILSKIDEFEKLKIDITAPLFVRVPVTSNQPEEESEVFYFTGNGKVMFVNRGDNNDSDVFIKIFHNPEIIGGEKVYTRFTNWMNIKDHAYLNMSYIGEIKISAFYVGQDIPQLNIAHIPWV